MSLQFSKHREINKIRNVGYIITAFAILISCFFDVFLWKKFDPLEWLWELLVIVLVAVFGIHLAMHYATKVLEKSHELEIKENDLNEAYLELGKINRQLASLVDVNASVASVESLEEILDYIVRSAAMLVKAEVCTIRVLDSKKKELVLKAQFGLDNRTYRKRIRVERSGLTRAIKENKNILLLDANEKSDFYGIKFARKNKLKYIICIPIKIKNKLVGNMTFYLNKKETFSGLNTGIILSFASQAAIALEISRQY